MKKTLLYFAAGLMFLCGWQNAQAQCVPVITTGNIIMCPNTTDTLWSDTHNTYQWMKDGILLANETNQFLIVNANNDAGSQFQVITTTTGCTGPDTSASVLVDGWVFLPPYVIEITDLNLCPGIPDTVMLEFSYDSSVQWYFNGNIIAGANNDTLIATAPGSYTVEGAPNVCPDFVMQLGMNIQVVTLPVTAPTVTPDSLMLCPGLFGTLATTASTYDSFKWYINGMEIMNSNTTSFMTQNAGHYHVVGYDEGCALPSDSSFVGFYNVTTPVITISGNQLVSVPGGSVLSNFQWYLNGTAIPGANDSTYTPTADGSYTVSANDGNCNDTSAAYVFALSVPEINGTNDLSIYPNPAQSEVHINSATAVSVALFDNVGRLVYTSSASRTHSINVSTLPRGIYMLKITGNDGAVCEKIMID